MGDLVGSLVGLSCVRNIFFQDKVRKILCDDAEDISDVPL